MGLPKSLEPLFAFEDGYNVIYDEKNPMDDDAKPFENTGGAMFSKVNWLKAGLLTCDELLTVSPAYAEEISRPGKGVELDSLINARGGAVGIVNGMDVDEWDPSKDKFLDVKYDASTVHQGKAAAKAALQAELGLPVDPSAPLFGVIGRLEEQKGTDILLSALPSLPANAQVAILGTGKAKYEAMLKSLGEGKSTGGAQVKAVVQFSAPLAHQINAGADFLIVPSRFEPCGLIQLHAMRYGTVPIVASTGGLVDTVQEGVTGLHIGALNPDALDSADVGALAATVARAAQIYEATPDKYRRMVEACVAQDLSWAQPAKKWEGVFEGLLSGEGRGTAKAASVRTPVEAKAAASV
jgi:granule-bound starch synthase